MARSEVIGQEAVLARLRAAARRGRVAHAYLFHGPEGVGKARMAVEFALLLSCERSEGDACGDCRPCRLIPEAWPDFLEVSPAEGRRFITVEQVREMVRRIHLCSTAGRYKVFVVRDADDLREDAQNILLKALEEPPAETVLVLISARPHRLLPTIHSRVQKVAFRPVPSEAVRRILAEQGAPAERIAFAVAFAGGRPGEALRLAAGDAIAVRDRVLETFLRLRVDRAFGLAEATYWDRFGGAGNLEGEREEMRLLLDAATRVCRDVLVCAAGARLPLFNEDRRPQVEALAARVRPGDAVHAADRLLRCRMEVDQNANLRLALQALLFDLAPLLAAPEGPAAVAALR